MTTPRGTLRRRLGVVDAAGLGLASMIGAGLFAVFAPAAQAAGSMLLLGVLVAAVVAVCNAAASVQLAVEDPRAGGAYLWGRRHLGEWPGFVAGCCFVVGKSASCAAIALTIAGYLVPAAARVPVALAALAVVTTVNCLGVQRTAAAARIVLIPVVLVVLTAIVVGLGSGREASVAGAVDPTPWGVLQAAGLVFFAFAGYARVATLAEEVHDPARVLPIGVAVAVAGTLLLYLASAWTLLTVLGPARLAASDAPWLTLAAQVGPWLDVPLRIAAVAAAGGSLLALVAGISRTALAMARERDLPAPLAAVQPRFGTPVRAEIAAALAAAVLVVAGDLRLAIGFSSFAVLLYYLVANGSALRQHRTHRLVPRAVPAVGAFGCAALAATLPWQSALAGAAVILTGCAVRFLRLRLA